MGATGPRGRQPYGMPSAANRYPLGRRASKDRPKIIVLAIVVALGGLCLYATIVTHLAQDMLLGPTPNPDQIAIFNSGMGRLPICVLPATLLAFLALLLYGVEAVVQRTRRAPPPACPRCGAVENAAVRFARTPIPGTGWATATCPQCQHEWHSKI